LHNAPLLKSLGATHVVDRSSDVRKEVANILRESGAPAPGVVYDAISDASTQPIAWDVLAPGGQLVLVLPAQVDTDKYKDKQIFNVFGTVHAPQNRDEGVKLYSKLTEWFSNGTLKVCRTEEESRKGH
jgi:NADPH:quinone reductase-like Zn-dependent oxidoreductase